MKDLSKIENWKIKNTGKADFWQSKFQSFLEYLRQAGMLLHSKGFMPQVSEKPKSTHGNMAVRLDRVQHFIITAAGSHKGKLRTEDFVLVRGINWKTGVITISAKIGKKPSTDVWLADAVFKNFPGRIGAIVHAHYFPNITSRISVSYPPLKKEEYKKVFEQIEKGSNIIILENHGCISLDVSIFGAVNLLSTQNLKNPD